MTPTETVNHIEARRAAFEAELSAEIGAQVQVSLHIHDGHNPPAITLPLAHAAAKAGGQVHIFARSQFNPTMVAVSYPNWAGRVHIFTPVAA